MACTPTHNATANPVANEAGRPTIACNLAPELMEALKGGHSLLKPVTKGLTATRCIAMRQISKRTH